MDYKKLFNVLVVGGAVLGGYAACDSGPQTPPTPPAPRTKTVTQDDGGSVVVLEDGGDYDGPGGVDGW